MRHDTFDRTFSILLIRVFEALPAAPRVWANAGRIFCTWKLLVYCSVVQSILVYAMDSLLLIPAHLTKNNTVSTIVHCKLPKLPPFPHAPTKNRLLSRELRLTRNLILRKILSFSRRLREDSCKRFLVSNLSVTKSVPVRKAAKLSVKHLQGICRGELELGKALKQMILMLFPDHLTHEETHVAVVNNNS